jgi:hypothetical protein
MSFGFLGHCNSQRVDYEASYTDSCLLDSSIITVTIDDNDVPFVSFQFWFDLQTPSFCIDHKFDDSCHCLEERVSGSIH